MVSNQYSDWYILFLHIQCAGLSRPEICPLLHTVEF